MAYSRADLIWLRVIGTSETRALPGLTSLMVVSPTLRQNRAKGWQPAADKSGRAGDECKHWLCLDHTESSGCRRRACQSGSGKGTAYSRADLVSPQVIGTS
jgi:hypothetical protein